MAQMQNQVKFCERALCPELIIPLGNVMSRRASMSQDSATPAPRRRVKTGVTPIVLLSNVITTRASFTRWGVATKKHKQVGISVSAQPLTKI